MELTGPCSLTNAQQSCLGIKDEDVDGDWGSVQLGEVTSSSSTAAPHNVSVPESQGKPLIKNDPELMKKWTLKSLLELHLFTLQSFRWHAF